MSLGFSTVAQAPVSALTGSGVVSVRSVGESIGFSSLTAEASLVIPVAGHSVADSGCFAVKYAKVTIYGRALGSGVATAVSKPVALGESPGLSVATGLAMPMSIGVSTGLSESFGLPSTLRATGCAEGRAEALANTWLYRRRYEPPTGDLFVTTATGLVQVHHEL